MGWAGRAAHKFVVLQVGSSESVGFVQGWTGCAVSPSFQAGQSRQLGGFSDHSGVQAFRRLQSQGVATTQ